MFVLSKQVPSACQIFPSLSHFRLVLNLFLLLVVSGGVVAAQVDDSVVFPSAEVEFIVGPQLRMGTTLNPHPWFDSTQATRGAVHGSAFPAVPPMSLTGTVSVTTGSVIVNGVGTRFLSEVDPAGPAYFNGRFTVREDGGATYRQVQVVSVQSDTQMTLTAPYSYSSQTGAEANTYFNDPGNGWNNDIYMNSNYYDLALCLYGLYYRTGNPTYLLQARKVADSWWRSPQIRSGTVRAYELNGYSPRNSSLGGLMLRALDGRPEMWDWLHDYTRYMLDIWVKQHLNDPVLYQGVRDGSYMMLYATWLSKVLPDSFPLQSGGTVTNGAALRVGLLSDTENAAANYYGRLQYADGSWRWDDGYYRDADGGTLQGVMQPFMIGLLMQALVEVHRASSNAGVKSSIQQQLTRACRHLYNDGPYRRNDIAFPGVRWRTFHYFYHGGTTVNPTKYEFGDGATATVPWEVTSGRQLIATSIPAYGYVYKITGDESFKIMGDELFESAFGDVTDGIHDEAAGTAKNYNQNYRMGGRYLAWRVGAVSPSPSPTPNPLPTPTPVPTPTPIPTPLPLFQGIMDSSNSPNYSETGGGWQQWDGGGHNGNQRFHNAGAGAAAGTWQLNGLLSGDYVVEATWVPGSSEATSAPWKIYNGAALVATLSVNNTQAPSGTIVNGRPFQTLATVHITSGTLKIVASETSTGQVAVDAVRVRSANIFLFMTASDAENGTVIAMNAGTHKGTNFEVTTPENFGPDKRTRLMIFATGISDRAINSNTANDLIIGGVAWINYAESVSVEARLSDGTIILLPVEFAGAQGLLPGLDQINVLLKPELGGAGLVQLTMIIGGQRSNAPTIVIQ